MRTTFGFTRNMRITRQGDFSRAFSQGSRARGDVLVVVAVANGTETTRLGLSIGRKIWKSAVKRNRVRRIFRESFRLCYPDLPRGVDLVLIAARPALVPKLDETRAELTRLAGKAHLRYLEKREKEARKDAAK